MAQATMISNPFTDAPLGLPYPLRGVLAPGARIVLACTPAQLETACPGIGASMRLKDLGAAYTGPIDSTYQGGLTSGDLVVADDLTVTGDAAVTGTLAVTSTSAFTGSVAMAALLRLAGSLSMVLADAGAAAASGTASAHAGTFTVASGQSGYVLTNTLITANSLLFCCCISGAVAQEVRSFIPTANTGTLLLSGAAGVNAKYAFLVITPAV